MENPSTLLVVYNLQISKDFYVNVLGLEVIEEFAGGVKLNIGNHEVYMFQGGMESIEYEHGYNANSTLVFTVEDLDKQIEELKSKGVVFVHKSPNQNKWGRYAAFKDPSGIVHELMEFFTRQVV
ncbi:VOC family protein [Neptunicella marina]|uniref:VOC family protein n=1 Tax=Neptunicella marina TaxID=2125989 RepID=A0A8J6M3K1_9ALTE|nr:VOC family protein [Neptunicella marina]